MGAVTMSYACHSFSPISSFRFLQFPLHAFPFISQHFTFNRGFVSFVVHIARISSSLSYPQYMFIVRFSTIACMSLSTFDLSYNSVVVPPERFQLDRLTLVTSC